MFDPIYIQRLLFFEPTMHEPLKNPNLFRTLRAPYPLLYGEKVAVAIPLPPPGERRRGSDDSDPFASPSPCWDGRRGAVNHHHHDPLHCPPEMRIDRFPRCCNPAGSLSILTPPKANKQRKTCKRQGRKGEEEGGGLQKLAGNGRMVVLTSPLTCYLSNSPPSIK